MPGSSAARSNLRSRGLQHPSLTSQPRRARSGPFHTRNGVPLGRIPCWDSLPTIASRTVSYRTKRQLRSGGRLESIDRPVTPETAIGDRPKHRTNFSGRHTVTSNPKFVGAKLVNVGLGLIWTLWRGEIRADGKYRLIAAFGKAYSGVVIPAPQATWSPRRCHELLRAIRSRHPLLKPSPR